MCTEELNDLLSLLAVTIIADKRVLSEEIDRFISASNGLYIARVIEPRLTEAKLLAWYEAHKDDLKQRLNGPDFEKWLYGCLNRLNHIRDKQAILDVMADIAVSDGELHVSERALMALTARHWNVGITV